MFFFGHLGNMKTSVSWYHAAPHSFAMAKDSLLMEIRRIWPLPWRVMVIGWLAVKQLKSLAMRAYKKLLGSMMFCWRCRSWARAPFRFGWLLQYGFAFRSYPISRTPTVTDPQQQEHAVSVHFGHACFIVWIRRLAVSWFVYLSSFITFLFESFSPFGLLLSIVDSNRDLALWIPQQCIAINATTNRNSFPKFEDTWQTKRSCWCQPFWSLNCAFGPLWRA